MKVIDSVFSWLFIAVGVLPAAAAPIAFNRDVRPILANHCFACHGPDSGQRQADLRLDIEEGAKADRDGSFVIRPGKPTASVLITRIQDSDQNLVMPPPHFQKPLTAQQKATLKRWIEQGAIWESHWAFRPLQRFQPPRVRGAKIRNEIDSFIVDHLQHTSSGLIQSEVADKITLVRRLSFDLRGLPPSQMEVQKFVSGDVTYEALIDSFLASESFGERMAQYWLDLVRYADSGGYHSDVTVHISPYRDYVIKSFNDNLPFNQFTIEQLAGDLLPAPTEWQMIATGYNRLNKTTEEGGAQPGEYLVKYAADRIRTTSGVWLGVTLGCAECHDHKYDPFTAKDFYSFGAFFADIKEVGQYRGGNRDPEIRVPTLPQRQELRRIDLEIQKAIDGQEQIRVNELTDAKAVIEKQFVRTMVTNSVAPREIRILPRGDWLNKTGIVVQPEVPVFLSLDTVDNEHRLTRLDLANWIVAKDNPLTSRVFVNRIWKLLFGRGISPRLDDVGAQGEPPTHPELLDYLAFHFMESDWDVKTLVKYIVLSHTYQQSSLVSAQAAKVDPENAMFARQLRWRLDAEFIRDTALSISGLLDKTVGGPSVFPYQPAGYWQYLNFPTRSWKADRGQLQYRRGLYTHWQRTFVHPSMLAFDAPTREECVAQRPVSNTPSAALTLLNDPSFVEAARALGQRVIQEGGTTDIERIHWLFQTVLSRRASENEMTKMIELLGQLKIQYAMDVKAAAELQAVGQFKLEPDVDIGKASAWAMLSRALLNVNEAICRN
ncbi:MAG: PSD1 and planctomycete cytochrome C domain-containing protein [Pirellulales bacterium]|nr:PSD1 and planctomycete cytochrome C domain-containing protein [Pirellulales bacterium]